MWAISEREAKRLGLTIFNPSMCGFLSCNEDPVELGKWTNERDFKGQDSGIVYYIDGVQGIPTGETCFTPIKISKIA